ncbi:MAG: hypothetical protein H6Q70_3665 [Firmicutes bacterium]|nr:hypothetical protein [Bacillota bacterium]
MIPPQMSQDRYDNTRSKGASIFADKPHVSVVYFDRATYAETLGRLLKKIQANDSIIF